MPLALPMGKALDAENLMGYYIWKRNPNEHLHIVEGQGSDFIWGPAKCVLSNGPYTRQENAPPIYSIKICHCLKCKRETALLLLRNMF